MTIQCKAGFLKEKKTTESRKTLKAKVAALEEKQTTVAIRTYLMTKNSKLITEIIQCLTGREAVPDRAKQTVDGYDHQNGRVTLRAEKFY